MRLFSSTTATLTELFSQKLTEKHDIEDLCFSSMERNTSRQHSVDVDPYLDMKTIEIGTLLNVSLERQNN